VSPGELKGPSPRAILEQRGHRPYPVSQKAWVALQRWRNVLFAHWRVPAASLESLLPSGLYLDRHRGEAWLGIVPFRISMRPRGLPGLSFVEVNVRTYVHDGSRPGVYFFSLDASSPLAVASARTLLNLPYFRAVMRMEQRDAITEFSSRRGTDTAELSTTYRTTGPVRHPSRGTLEHFLTERYCLYGVHRWLGLFRIEIHHPPWSLQPADAHFRVNTLTDALDVELESAPLIHAAAAQDVLTWLPDRVAARQRARHGSCLSPSETCC
jgi:uncharacterized protein